MTLMTKALILPISRDTLTLYVTPLDDLRVVRFQLMSFTGTGRPRHTLTDGPCVRMFRETWSTVHLCPTRWQIRRYDPQETFRQVHARVGGARRSYVVESCGIIKQLYTVALLYNLALHIPCYFVFLSRFHPAGRIERPEQHISYIPRYRVSIGIRRSLLCIDRQDSKETQASLHPV